MSFPDFNKEEKMSKDELNNILKDLQDKYDKSSSPLHKPILKSRIDRIINLIQQIEDLTKYNLSLKP